MNTIISVLITILIIGVVVIAHEYGHMYAAKKNGVIVEEFAIGMGPILISKEKDGTLYTLRLFPIGGYCKMLGEDGESENEGAFNNKKVSQRMIIIAAGAIMNFLLAFILQFFLTSVDIVRLPIVSDVNENSPAEAAGLSSGDTILKYDGKKTRTFQEVSFAIFMSEDKETEIVFRKPSGEIKTKKIKPMFVEEEGSTIKDGKTEGRYIIGFTSNNVKIGPLYKYTIKTQEEKDVATNTEVLSIGEYISYSINNVVFNTKTIFYGLRMIISSPAPLDDLMGPVGLVGEIETTYTETKEYGLFQVIRIMVTLAILISANLGVVNLLPIPAVDGGRLVFLFIEALRGKPLAPEKEGIVHFIGIVALMVLAAVVAINDIQRLFAV